jgi:transcriptional regulator with XRE-family HTH domain
LLPLWSTSILFWFTFRTKFKHHFFDSYLFFKKIIINMLVFKLSTPQEAATELGHRLRAHRVARLLTQAELAARAGVSVGTLRTLEASGRTSTDALLRVAMALGLADQLQSLFVLPLQSINQMDLAERTQRVQRVRAPRRQAPL